MQECLLYDKTFINRFFFFLYDYQRLTQHSQLVATLPSCSFENISLFFKTYVLWYIDLQYVYYICLCFQMSSPFFCRKWLLLLFSSLLLLYKQIHILFHENHTELPLLYLHSIVSTCSCFDRLVQINDWDLTSHIYVSVATTMLIMYFFLFEEWTTTLTQTFISLGRSKLETCF